MKWSDTQTIAASLQKLYPGTDPLSLRFTDLHQMVTRLPGFEDSPQACSEEALEKIQMAWYNKN